MKIRFAAPLNHDLVPILQWIEVASTFSLPSFHIIGLPDREVAEARDRVRAAIEASLLEFPKRRIVLNLSPASVRKRGTGMDLAMALAILVSANRDNQDIDGAETASWVAWGELGLDGRIKPAGQLLRAIHASWKEGISKILVSSREAHEAARRLSLLRRSGIFQGPPPQLIPVGHLQEAWEIVNRLRVPQEVPALEDFELPRYSRSSESLMPISETLQRVLGVASSGEHHLLLLGPKGTGKSHCLEWFAALTPSGSALRQVHQGLLEELSGNHDSRQLSAHEGSIRTVGSQVRPQALLGQLGSNFLRPGEFALAHGGVLIADELPEWSRDSRESLREPLESGFVNLTRANGSVRLPARFILAANGNLCPCGGWPPEFPYPLEGSGEERKKLHCRCRASTRKTYLARLSGPILDRIDLVLVSPSRASTETSFSSHDTLFRLREKAQSVRQALVTHWGGLPGSLTSSAIQAILDEHPDWQQELDQTPFPSLRARHKIARVSLTLAAWDGVRYPTRAHLAESLCYRAERYRGFG